jgi:hypothetical protein
MQAYNGNDYTVSLPISDGKVDDGIHIQPYGRVTLPQGFSVTNAGLAMGKIRIENDPVVLSPATPAPAVVAPKT